MTLAELITTKIIDSSIRITEYDDDEDGQNLNKIPENLHNRTVDYIEPSYDGLLKIDIILA